MKSKSKDKNQKLSIPQLRDKLDMIVHAQLSENNERIQMFKKDNEELAQLRKKIGCCEAGIDREYLVKIINKLKNLTTYAILYRLDF
jgi:hypothetical protein